MNFAIKRNRLICFLLIIFWYISLYPGRLSYDSSEAIRMIQRGESTSLWTNSFFHFLRITSFFGNQIYIPSLICICGLAFSLGYFISSIGLSVRIRSFASIAVFSSPLFGVFGVTVSHDVFQAIGIILLISIELRKQKNLDISRVTKCILVTSLLMSHFGIFLGIFYILRLFFIKKFKENFLFILLFLIIYSISSLGITKFDNSWYYVPMITDIKCIAQHPDAELSDTDWQKLRILAPENEWKNPVSCRIGDYLVSALPSIQIYNLSRTEWIKLYLNSITHNPYIFIYAHIQRSTVALPPPFFQSPQNQVSRDYLKPIGFGSNSELQQGLELLHTSIDEISVANRISILKPFEYLALLPAFLVNQASWFWAWGGLWLWPIAFLWHKKSKGVSNMFATLYPIILLHLFLFALSPVSSGRYVMSTILLGYLASAVLLFEKIENS